MPFTIAHPAAVLPLRRTALPFDALVIGSMAPDFEYLLRLSPTSAISHTPWGLLAFCLPSSLLVLALWRFLWRPALPKLLAGVAPLEAERPDKGPGQAMVLIPAAILLGAASHLFWDSFTHGGGFMVARLAVLRVKLWESGHGTLRPYKLLQHASTLAGLALLARCFFRSGGRDVRVRRERGTFAVVLAVVTLAVAVVSGVGRSAGSSGLGFAQTFVGSAVLAAAATLLVLGTASALFMRLRR